MAVETAPAMIWPENLREFCASALVEIQGEKRACAHHGRADEENRAATEVVDGEEAGEGRDDVDACRRAVEKGLAKLGRERSEEGEQRGRAGEMDAPDRMS